MYLTRTDKIRNEFAAYGLDILKRSVLLVLYEAEQMGPPRLRKLKMDEIGCGCGVAAGVAAVTTLFYRLPQLDDYL